MHYMCLITEDGTFKDGALILQSQCDIMARQRDLGSDYSFSQRVFG